MHKIEKNLRLVLFKQHPRINREPRRRLQRGRHGRHRRRQEGLGVRRRVHKIIPTKVSQNQEAIGKVKKSFLSFQIEIYKF